MILFNPLAFLARWQLGSDEIILLKCVLAWLAGIYHIHLLIKLWLSSYSVPGYGAPQLFVPCTAK
jgi:hypothetical protein